MSSKTAKMVRRIAEKTAKRQAGMIAETQVLELLKARFWIRLKFALRIIRGK
ncbi:MAG: hypothetical protein LBQ88_03580 [Treponema sp.]|jgi:hypothetical protein|nr:hypothetical protein [Treponema sp.]